MGDHEDNTPTAEKTIVNDLLSICLDEVVSQSRGKRRDKGDKSRLPRGRGKGRRQGRFGGDRQRQRVAFDAETLHADSKAARDDKLVIFDCSSGKPKFDLCQWFRENLPTETRRSDGIGFIAVLADKYDAKRDVGLLKGESVDHDSLIKEWHDLTTSKSATIDYGTLIGLARKHDLLGGKWLFHLDSGSGRVDEIWKRVALELAYNKLPESAVAVKISPVSDQDPMHVVCVYNRDFTQEGDVLAVEKALRNIPLRCQLLYKPNIFSALGIYRNNAYKLRPTIYSSTLQVHSNQSVVESVFDMGWSYTTGPSKDDNNNVNLERKLLDRVLISVQDAITQFDLSAKEMADSSTQYDPKDVE